MTFFSSLDHRALIAVSGEEAKTFLQGLVSADITKLSPEQALYGAFLTPQGRFLHEFFATERDGTILLETERERRADFVKGLSIYKLRSKVVIKPMDELSVFALFGEPSTELPVTEGETKPLADGLAFRDPRLAAAGWRAWLPDDAALTRTGFVAADKTTWDRQRMNLGLADGSRDMAPDKTLLLENGFDELHGADWQKGCYLGQELTSRTKYRGLVKKRLMPVAIEGEAPAFGTALLLGEKEAGEMRSSSGDVGLALVRLDAFAEIQTSGGALTAPGARLVPRKPDWAAF